jgi:hypothetical protein
MVQIGNEKRTKTIAAGVLLVSAMFLLYQRLHSSLAGPNAVNSPSVVEAKNASAKSRSHAGEHRYVAFSLKPTLDPRLRLDLLAISEGVQYGGSGRNIFADDSVEIPKVIAPVVVPNDKQAEKPPWAAPPLPPAPPINLKFWGWANSSGESKAIFLSQGENGFVAHEGDIIARRYKVVKIGPTSVEVEDLLSNNRQSLPLAF